MTDLDLPMGFDDAPATVQYDVLANKQGHELVDADLSVAEAAAEPLRVRPVDGTAWQFQDRHNAQAWIVGETVPVER